jgi:hypothetical protein
VHRDAAAGLPVIRPPAHQQPPQRRQLPAPQAPAAREPAPAETFPRWPAAQHEGTPAPAERLQPLPPAHQELLQPLPPPDARDDWNARQPTAEYQSNLGYPQHSNGARDPDQPLNGRYAADPEHTADLLPGSRGRHAGPSGAPPADQGRR